jgi:hypothetical protein
MSMRQENSAPTRKVTIGAATGAATAIIVWIANEFDLLPGGKDIPGDIGAALTTLLTFIASYFVSPSPKDSIVSTEDNNS